MPSPEQDTVARWFQEYVHGFMENDISGAIKGGLNYLAALGLAVYTEVIGRFIITSGLQARPEASFRVVWDRMGPSYKSFGSGRAYGLIRSAMVHYYFVQAGKQGAGPAGVATSGSTPLVVDAKGNLIWVVVERWFDDWKAAAASVERDVKADTATATRAEAVIHGLMRTP